MAVYYLHVSTEKKKLYADRPFISHQIARPGPQPILLHHRVEINLSPFHKDSRMQSSHYFSADYLVFLKDFSQHC